MAKKVENPETTEVTQVEPVVEQTGETQVEQTVKQIEETQTNLGEETSADLSEETSADFVTVDDDQMEIVVLKRFRDKFGHTTYYEVGSEISFDVERAIDVIERGLAKLKEQ